MSRRAAASLSSLLFLILAAGSGCKKPRDFVNDIDEPPYPTCPAENTAPPETLFEEMLRAGSQAREPNTIEEFAFERRGCLIIGRSRIEFPATALNLEIVFDSEYRPLRIWKRMTWNDVEGGRPEIRAFFITNDRVTMKRLHADGSVDYAVFRGERPLAVIPPGRGLLSGWLQRTRLDVGGKERVWALDVREDFELLKEVTLKREADDVIEETGVRARVFTIYGREPIFADDRNVVIGDMLGQLQARFVTTRMPPRAPIFGPIDPVHTP